MMKIITASLIPKLEKNATKRFQILRKISPKISKSHHPRKRLLQDIYSQANQDINLYSIAK